MIGTLVVLLYVGVGTGSLLGPDPGRRLAGVFILAVIVTKVLLERQERRAAPASRGSTQAWSRGAGPERSAGSNEGTGR